MKATQNEDLKPYLKDIARRPLLSREQEVSLFERLEAGDESAREIIVESNLRFVVKMAVSFMGRGVSLSDLIQEGNIGLLEVVDKFDYRKGYRFSTYAAFWIRQAIQLALRKQCNLIRLPIRKSRFLGHLTEAINELTQANGSAPAVGELAAKLNVPAEDLEHLMQLRDSVLSLDSESDEEGTQLLNRIPDSQSPSPREHCLREEARRRVASALESLSEREQKVLRLRYGFHDGENRSLRSTSKLVGMSQEGVRRVERNAISKLRRSGAHHAVLALL